ncbi:MAG: GNAT family N-acetyltransferase [Candidatus Gastranaerophilales bacterium]|nr:GNAT family N-acetyltransferase [Candidatus Gastranaerophilales bacterium]
MSAKNAGDTRLRKLSGSMKNKLIIKELYKIEKKDIKRCAEIAAKAFIDDNSCRFILAANLTFKSLYDFHLMLYKSAFDRMYMFSESEKINSLIIITPLKNAELSILKCIKEGALKIIFSQGAGIALRAFHYEQNCIKMHNKFATKGSWYIFQFCVVPEEQGKKLGSKTLCPILKWMDSNNINCCLETHKTVNVEIYKHFGFSLKTVNTLPMNNGYQYAMYR